ncbi:protein of unknown function [Lentzea xinjiangensis]|uniref:DUF305 domain-containing protein n=1 Tax=Lentzea xinjiangensis TaxID=402600 RepID=A0A1H9K3Z1_9PSEU|nr:DUF305 domain-containing protein [Lentzea xinjiangensis]SEQ93738.1 protein of unknown function [Lentzea xinjiangensis]
MRVLAIAAVLVVAGCGATVAAAPPAGPAPAGSLPAGSLPAGSVQPSPGPAGLSPTDLAFVELVIPQNESALAAVTVAATRPGSALRPVASRVEAGYRAELAVARELLALAGRQETGLHDGHDMPGMITTAELAALGSARDTAFDQHLEQLLRTQFEEARTVARAELSSGKSAPALELGARIERTRAEFLALLDAS